MPFESFATPDTHDPRDLVAKLGASLVDSGAIDRRTLDCARRVASETGARLDQVLTQLGLISDRGLAEALAHLIAAPLVGAADYPDAPLFHDRLKPKFGQVFAEPRQAQAPDLRIRRETIGNEQYARSGLHPINGFGTSCHEAGAAIENQRGRRSEALRGPSASTDGDHRLRGVRQYA